MTNQNLWAIATIVPLVVGTGCGNSKDVLPEEREPKPVWEIEDVLPFMIENRDEFSTHVAAGDAREAAGSLRGIMDFAGKLKRSKDAEVKAVAEEIITACRDLGTTTVEPERANLRLRSIIKSAGEMKDMEQGELAEAAGQILEICNSVEEAKVDQEVFETQFEVLEDAIQKLEDMQAAK